MTKPLVSILIPAYNAEKCIADTLRSAIAQTWPNKEILVVNDGSPDGTLSVARQFESSDVKVVSQENQGAAATRNKLFSLCQGDYVQWLDADDLLCPTKVSRQMALVESGLDERTLVSGEWGHFFWRHNRTKFIPTALWSDLSPVEWLLRKMEQNLHQQTATWLVSRGLTEKAGAWNTKLLGDDDGEYFCRVLMASNGVRFAPGARVYYRVPGSNSLSYIGQSPKKIEAQWRSMELHMKYLRSLEDSERSRAACVTYMQNWMINFYPEHGEIVSRAQELASELGGRIEAPRLSWKYSWIKTLFGWNWAKRARVALPALRWSVTRSWDGAMFRLQDQGFAVR